MLGISAALAIVLVMAACGGGGGSKATTAPTKAASSAATTGGAVSGAAAAGQKVYQANCATCHSVNGTKIVGPTWKGLYGSKVELESGDTVTVDDAYIKESIETPNAKIVKGYPAAMPSFKGVLSDQQINDVIAYMKTLK